MSKFCTLCGAELNDNASFCTSCGAKQNPVNQAEPNVNANANNQSDVAAMTAAADNMKNAVVNGVSGATEKIKSSKHGPLIIVGVLVALVIILFVIVFCLIFGGGNYETPVKNFVKVCEKGDGKAYRDMIMASDKEIKALEKVLELTDEGDFDDYCQEQAEDIQESVQDKYGDNVKISYDIVDKEELDEDELKKLNKKTSLFGLLGSDDDAEITQAYKLSVEFDIEGENDESTQEKEFTVAKYDGKWVFTDYSYRLS